MARSLAEVKLHIEVARTIQEDASESEHNRGMAWSQVQQDYLRLTLLEAESVLYAGRDVVEIMRRVQESFDEVSDKTNGFDVPELPAKKALLWASRPASNVRKNRSCSFFSSSPRRRFFWKMSGL